MTPLSTGQLGYGLRHIHLSLGRDNGDWLVGSPRIGQHAHLTEFYYTIGTNVEAIIAFWDDVLKS